MTNSEIIAEARDIKRESIIEDYAHKAREVFESEGIYTWEEMDELSNQDILDEALDNWGTDFLND